MSLAPALPPALAYSGELAASCSIEAGCRPSKPPLAVADYIYAGRGVLGCTRSGSRQRLHRIQRILSTPVMTDLVLGV